MIVITGRTCSGKDTLGKFLEKEYGFKKVISYTTRPPRSGEENGKDYIFVSNDEFEAMLKNGEFAESTSYKQENGDIWRYGTTKDDYKEEKDTRKLYAILNPEGVMQLIQNGCHVDIFHLKDDFGPRLRDRYILRELGDTSNMNNKDDDKRKKELIVKFNVRFAQDKKDFTPYEEGLSTTVENHPEVDSVHQIGSYTKSSITKILISLGYIVEEDQITFGSLRHIIPINSIVEFCDKDDGHFIFSISPYFFEFLNYDDRRFYDGIHIYAMNFRYEKNNEPYVMLQIDISDLKKKEE